MERRWGGDGDVTSQGSLIPHALPGIPYAVRILSITRIDSGGSVAVDVGFFSGHTPIDAVAVGTYPIPYTGPGPWFTWVPTAERAAYGVHGLFSGTDAGDLITVTTELWWGNTMPERRGLPRARVLPIRSALTPVVAERFGDLWLDEHEKAPFNGTLTLSGSGIRMHQGGAPVPAASMLRAAGEKIRFTDQIDPDTGAWGRDGTIAGVTYRPEGEALTIAIDDRRDHFESVLSRYGVLVDQFGG